MDEIVAAAKLANADEFIVKMPNGYDTMVGERGSTMSGGQRQRIGIARALIRDTPILILDEPTAALDAESERLVIDGLTKLKHGRTVFTIAHRLSTIRDANRILVLDGGVVAEMGTHEELHRPQRHLCRPLPRAIRNGSGQSRPMTMSRTIIILPDDTAQPISMRSTGARKTLRVKMFVFSDPGLLAAVVAARKRGVEVRVMLNKARRDGEDDNAASRKTLAAAGVDVHDSNPAFDLTHEKSMVVDDAVAFVKSLNWETRNLTVTRDYAVVTSHHHEVDEVIAGFEADWHRKTFDPGAKAHLIWCSNNGRERIAHFIDSAKHTLFVQNERYQDTVIVERLVRAVRRGVKVHIMARPPHTLKKDKLIEGVGGLRIVQDVGAKVHRMKKLRLHAKLLLADHERAIIGSINLAPGSFDSRRELAIELDRRSRHRAAVRHRPPRLAPLGTARPFGRRAAEGPRQARRRRRRQAGAGRVGAVSGATFRDSRWQAGSRSSHARSGARRPRRATSAAPTSSCACARRPAGRSRASRPAARSRPPARRRADASSP